MSREIRKTILSQYSIKDIKDEVSQFTKDNYRSVLNEVLSELTMEEWVSGNISTAEIANVASILLVKKAGNKIRKWIEDARIVGEKHINGFQI